MTSSDCVFNLRSLSGPPRYCIYRPLTCLNFLVTTVRWKYYFLIFKYERRYSRIRPGHSEDLALTRSNASNTTNTVSKLTVVCVIVEYYYGADIQCRRQWRHTCIVNNMSLPRRKKLCRNLEISTVVRVSAPRLAKKKKQVFKGSWPGLHASQAYQVTYTGVFL